MKESDQLATSFIMSFGSYCYVLMPFGLKNAGATYQRCMQACFSDQINPPIDPDRPDPPRATVVVYVDDIVVKTPRADDLVTTLSTTFTNLKRFNIKLNPEKCTFGVRKGKLLGYSAPSVASRLTATKSRPSPTWDPSVASRASRG